MLSENSDTAALLGWPSRRLTIALLSLILLLCQSPVASAEENAEQALLAAAKRGLTDTVRKLIAKGVDTETRDKDGRTALMLAAWPGHIEVVRELLKAGADVAAQDKKGDTALHRAAQGGDKTGDVVDALIAASADPNLRGAGGRTAFVAAASHGSVGNARKLIARGADVNLQTAGGETALTLAQKKMTGRPEEILELLAEVEAEVSPEHAFILAAKYCELEEVKALIGSGIDVNATDQYGGTALMRAAGRANRSRDSKQHCLEVARTLLQAGADVGRENSAGRNALSIAVAAKRREMIEVLMAAGATLPPDEALQWAMSEEDLEAVEAAIRDGADVDVRGRSGRTALHLAARNDDLLQITRVLLAAGADANVADDGGLTPLHIAVVRPVPRIVNVLLEAGADPNRADSRGSTPLLVAAGKAIADPAKALIAAGADVHATSSEGLSPLHIAARYGRTKIVSALLAAGADPNARTDSGETPLELALGKGHQEAAEALQAVGGGVSGEGALQLAAKEGDLETVRELLEGDVDLKAGRLGEAVLHAAASSGHAEIVRVLLDRNVDPNARGRGGNALHIAAASGHVEIVRALAAAGADLEARDPSQATPLIRAVLAGRAETVRELASLGADLEATGEQGFTALTWAAFYGHSAVVRELLAAGAAVTARDLAVTQDKPQIRKILAEVAPMAAAGDTAEAGPKKAIRIWLEVAAKKKPVDALDAVVDWTALARRAAAANPEIMVSPDAVAWLMKQRFQESPPALAAESIDTMLLMTRVEVAGDTATVRLRSGWGEFRLAKSKDGSWRITQLPAKGKKDNP